MIRGVDDKYLTLGYSSRAFRKTRHQLFVLTLLVQACNYADISNDCGLMLLELLRQCQTHKDRVVHSDGTVVSIPVKSTRNGPYGRYSCKVSGHRGASVVGWTKDDEPIFSKGSTYAYTYGPMIGIARNHIAYMLYHDVDICNCHPVITKFLFDLLGFECPILSKYVARRDEYLAALMRHTGCDREAVKRLMLIAHNDGCLEGWCVDNGVPEMPPGVAEYKAEMLRNRKLLLETPLYSVVKQAMIKLGKKHPSRSAFAVILQDWERRIMECLVLVAESRGWVVSAHVYDGFMVRSHRELSSDEMEIWTETVFGVLGVKVSLVRKPLVVQPELAAMSVVIDPERVAFLDRYRPQAVQSPDEIIAEAYLDSIDPRRAEGIEIEHPPCGWNGIDCWSLEGNDEPCVIFSLAHMGSGKTYVIAEYADKPDQRVLAVSPRVSHATEVAQRMQMELYLDHRGNAFSIDNMKNLERFMTTVDSCHFLNGAEPYNIVVADESEAIFSQFHSETLKHVASCWHFIETAIVECTGMVYISDACLTKRTVETVMRLVGNRRCVLRVNPFQKYPRKFVVLKTENPSGTPAAKEAFTLRILDYIKAGQRVVVVSASRTFADALMSRIQADPVAWGRIKDAYRYYSAGSDDVQMQEDLRDIAAAWALLLFLMYTPVLTVGNNFDKPGVFDKMFVYAEPRSVTGNDVLQAAFRVRDLVDTEVTVFIAQSTHDRLPTTMEAVQAAVSKHAEKCANMIKEHSITAATMRDHQLVKMYTDICERYEDPTERLKALEALFERLKRKHDRLYAIEQGSSLSLVNNYYHYVLHVNMWRKYYAAMFKKLVVRMGHEYGEEILATGEASGSKGDRAAAEQAYSVAYLSIDRLRAHEVERIESAVTNKEASEDMKIKLHVHYFDVGMDALVAAGLARDLDRPHRAAVFAKKMANKKYSFVFLHVIAESKSCDELMMREARLKDGYFQLCASLPVSRDIIKRMCDKLGLANSLDTTKLVRREVIERDLEGFRALAQEARDITLARASQSRDPDYTFKKALCEINTVLRAWSDVDLKDVEGGKSVRKPKKDGGDGGFTASQVMRVSLGDFTELFADSV